MKKTLKILIVSRSKSDLKELAALIEPVSGTAVTQQVIGAHSADPLERIDELPDLLVICLSDQWENELNGIALRSPSERPTMLVCGPPDQLTVLRRAMQAGARDFFSTPVDADEITGAIRQIQADFNQAQRAGKSKIFAVVNAKGGSGSSAIACNVAHCIAAVNHQRTALLDLDLQFGAISLYLDLRPQYSLSDAIEIGENLDRVSLNGCMAKHASGLHVLGPQADQLILPGELRPEKLGNILNVMSDNYDYIIADLPRQIDPVNSHMLVQADKILIVLQQSLSHCRDAVRLIDILTNGLGIDKEKLLVLVNRFDPRNSIQKKNIEQTLRQDRVVTIPNDYKRVAESVNVGIPLLDLDAKAKVTGALLELVAELTGTQAPKRGLFGAPIFSKGRF